MRSTTERIKLAKKQADEIKKQRNEKRHRLAVISCYAFGIALIVVISALVCNLNFAGFDFDDNIKQTFMTQPVFLQIKVFLVMLL